MKTTRIELELTDSQIDQLRQVIDWPPLARYATLICAVLPKLPLTESDAGTPSSAAADPAPVISSRESGGFSITAFTPAGRKMLPYIERVLGMVEVDPS